MNKLVLRDHLFSNNGTASDVCIQNNSPPIISDDWDYSQPMSISDVKIWEELYVEPYNIGLYSSWNPYVEFYLIVYYDFVDDKRFKTFYGLDSHTDLKRYLDQCEIILPINSINL